MEIKQYPTTKAPKKPPTSGKKAFKRKLLTLKPISALDTPSFEDIFGRDKDDDDARDTVNPLASKGWQRTGEAYFKQVGELSLNLTPEEANFHFYAEVSFNGKVLGGCGGYGLHETAVFGDELARGFQGMQ